jgi:hypothetical protein
MRHAALLLALAWAAASRAEPPPADATRARARQLASLLNLEPNIEIILRGSQPQNLQESIAHLAAIEQTMIALSRAQLTLEGTLGRLQHEEFAAKNAHDLLESHHLDSVARWSLAAVIVGEGVTIVGTGMQFGNETVTRWGNGVAIAGSAIAAGFSITALVKRHNGPLPLSIQTNMLAPLFGREATLHSRFADWMWQYLDTPMPGASDSIRRQLVEKWTREGRVAKGDALEAERRIKLLCDPLRGARSVDAEILDSRADMLADLRERLASLNEDLELLWREVEARR